VAAAGAPTTIKIGDKVLTPPTAATLPGGHKFDEASTKSIGAFKKDLADALKAAGYPPKAKPIAMLSAQWWSIVGILSILVLYVTMVYGPIAAMLVELFPTRIRYTSMSLPYHIGNGWFGGLLPSITFAMVASNGNMYYGLWYPIIVAAVCFVIGLLFVRETKDVDIYAQD
jgi:Sugar (and other) transporter